ncbi:hypothetical protein Pelo_3264 [Pelomyxa schiedti]|nr:hypothetical protein Pelo_3264 [Pelomyxa schiedti]
MLIILEVYMCSFFFFISLCIVEEAEELELVDIAKAHTWAEMVLQLISTKQKELLDAKTRVHSDPWVVQQPKEDERYSQLRALISKLTVFAKKSNTTHPTESNHNGTVPHKPIPHLLEQIQHGAIPTHKMRNELCLSLYKNISTKRCYSAVHCGSIIELKFLYVNQRLYLAGCGTVHAGIPHADTPTEAFLIDLQKGTIRALPHGRSTVAEISINCDSSLISTAGNDGTIKVWSTVSSTLMPTVLGKEAPGSSVFSKHSGPVSRILSHHTHQQVLVSAGLQDNKVALWDIFHGDSKAVYDIKTFIYEMGFGCDSFSEHMVVAHDTSSHNPSANVKILWTDEEEAVRDKRTTTCVGMSKTSPSFFLGGTDQKAIMYDFRSLNKSAVTLYVPHSEITAVSYSPCEKYVAISGEMYNVVSIYDVRFPARPAAQAAHQLSPMDIHHQFRRSAPDSLPQGAAQPVWSRAGLLFTGGEDCKVCIWDIRRSQFPINTLVTHKDAVTGLAITDDNWNIPPVIASGDDMSGLWVHSGNGSAIAPGEDMPPVPSQMPNDPDTETATSSDTDTEAE